MNKRNYLFDILKGLSIIFVCITHFAWQQKERLNLLFPYWISMAVPIFMIITGFLSAASYNKIENINIKKIYNINNLKNKIIKYLIPFIIFYIFEIIINLIVGDGLSIISIIKGFFVGGLKKYGTYYLPVLIQLTLIFPALFLLIKKYKYGLHICFIINLLYEILKNILHMPGSVYRIVAFRYIFMISCGCYIYFNKEKLKDSKMKLLLSLIFGIFYIWLISYSGYKPMLLNKWKNTSMMTAFYICPIFVLLIDKFKEKRLYILEKIGEKSYFIFLFQIIYYNYINKYVLINNRTIKMVIGVLICLVCGYIYGIIYDKIRKLCNTHKTQ